jgi:DNA-binding NtrC family response regulator
MIILFSGSAGVSPAGQRATSKLQTARDYDSAVPKLILISWIGQTDLNAAEGDPRAGIGPIAQAAAFKNFARIVLLSDYPEDRTQGYLAWLGARTRAELSVRPVVLSSPMHFGEIYRAARQALSELTAGPSPAPALTIHLSPGTPAMAAVWILLAKTRFPAELIQSSAAHGVEIASVPFDIAAEFLPDVLHEADRRLSQLSAGQAPAKAEFNVILHRSAVMRRLLLRAEKVALRSVPVLIEGESGTGKELLARAIHAASPRRDRPFIPVNCGAIPAELVESELFGHVKGAFTGALRDRAGVFEAADGGTLFLDEVGELPLAAQVKLLRVVQEQTVTRVGATQPVAVNTRIIAATNRQLVTEIQAGRFREDLFYRLAVAVLKLPPLREREGDLSLLIDRLREQVNQEGEEDPGHQHKNLSPGARNLMLTYHWPGNVRELLNTLRRAVLWSEGATITEDDLHEALLLVPASKEEQVLGRPLTAGFNLEELLGEVARHYLERALAETGSNKTRAAELLGFANYQTLGNWLKKYGAEK